MEGGNMGSLNSGLLEMISRNLFLPLDFLQRFLLHWKKINTGTKFKQQTVERPMQEIGSAS